MVKNISHCFLTRIIAFWHRKSVRITANSYGETGLGLGRTVRVESEAEASEETKWLDQM
jgi:hypothetical protein